jgi:hypothetical protein
MAGPRRLGPAEADVAHDAAPAAVEFLLQFTGAGDRAGYPTADLEDRVVALAEALGLRGAEISATPTLVEVSFGSLPHQRDYTLRSHARPTVAGESRS